jgi:putative Mg2+ transporter-C (MgtC) family protein
MAVQSGRQPVAHRVDRLPASTQTEIETSYRFRTVCQVADQSHIRALLVQELARDGFVLHSVRSHDIDTGCGLAEITADLHRYGRDDLALEAAVNRLSIQPAVSSVSWNACEPAALVQAEE